MNLTTRRERDRQVNRFARKFKRSVNFQVRNKELTKEEGAVLTAAMDSDKIVKNGRTYSEQLFFELYQIAGEFFDNVWEWLAAAYQWILENWETVLRVALTILLMLI